MQQQQQLLLLPLLLLLLLPPLLLLLLLLQPLHSMQVAFNLGCRIRRVEGLRLRAEWLVRV